MPIQHAKKPLESSQPPSEPATLEMQKALRDEMQEMVKSIFQHLRIPETSSNNMLPMKLPHSVQLSNNDPEPGTNQEMLTLKYALRFTLPLASVWHNMGVLLGVDSGTLKKIDHDYRMAQDCLREMLQEWLKQINPHPTWQALADAVEPFDPNTAQVIRNM